MTEHSHTFNSAGFCMCGEDQREFIADPIAQRRAQAAGSVQFPMTRFWMRDD